MYTCKYSLKWENKLQINEIIKVKSFLLKEIPNRLMGDYLCYAESATISQTLNNYKHVS